MRSAGAVLSGAALLLVAPAALAVEVPLSVPYGCLLQGSCWSDARGVERSTAGGPDALEEQTTLSVLPSSLPEDIKSKALVLVRAQTAQAFSFSLSQQAEIDRWPGNVYGSPPPAVAKEMQAALTSEGLVLCAGAHHWLAAPDNVKAADPMLVAATYEVYLDNCFSRVDGRFPDIARRIVYLFSDFGTGEPAVYCMGFLVGGNTIVTAKHCLVENGEVEIFNLFNGSTETNKFIENVRLLPRTKILTLIGPPFIYDVKLAASVVGGQRYNPNVVSTDAVLLEAQGLPADLAPFPIEKALQWDQALIVGQFVPDSVWRNVDKPDVLEQILSSSMRMDDGPACRAFYVGEGCIYHTCQTVAGFSGTPFFSVRGDHVALVGVHSGATPTESPMCAFKRATIYPNYAVDITAADDLGGWFSQKDR